MQANDLSLVIIDAAYRADVSRYRALLSFRGAHADYIERVRAWVLANDADIYAECRKVLAFGVVELIRPEPPITQPTLVMTCEHDSGSTTGMSQAIASEIDGAQVVIVPGLQHMGLVENPSFFLNEIADFLESTLPRPGGG